MEKLNLTFSPLQVLTSEAMNKISSGVDEVATELTALDLKVGDLETQMGDVSALLDELNS